MENETDAGAAEAPANEPARVYTLAIIDETTKDEARRGLLLAFRATDNVEEWVRKPGQYPFPHNEPDLAVERYRLVELAPGKERFVPLHHPLDGSAENSDALDIVTPLVRAILEIDDAGRLKRETRTKLTDFIASFDVRGFKRGG